MFYDEGSMPGVCLEYAWIWNVIPGVNRNSSGTALLTNANICKVCHRPDSSLAFRLAFRISSRFISSLIFFSNSAAFTFCIPSFSRLRFP